MSNFASSFGKEDNKDNRDNIFFIVHDREEGCLSCLGCFSRREIRDQ